MERKLLYTIGNLYTGYPWGVECERQFGTIELHGPFNTENAANTYAHEILASYNDEGPYKSVKVVKIETPQAGRHIVHTGRGEHGGWEYAV
jgi:hypothetical protein